VENSEVVANRETRTWKTGGGKGSRITLNKQGIVDPKR